MVATPSRIAFVTESGRSVIASDAAVRTRYGNVARDTLEEPAQTYFDDEADAQIIVNERFALLSGNRRLFQTTVSRLLNFAGALDFAQVAPTVTIIDDEKGVNMTAIITGIDAKDYERETTKLNVWG
jgi:hypothetical protein